ncbi:hypothetical protein [Anaerosporobacter sp.]
MILRKPVIKMVGDDDNKVPQIQKFEQKYSEEDLILDFMFVSDEEDDDDAATDADDTDVENETVEDDEDWLSKL